MGTPGFGSVLISERQHGSVLGAELGAPLGIGLIFLGNQTLVLLPIWAPRFRFWCFFGSASTICSLSFGLLPPPRLLTKFVAFLQWENCSRDADDTPHLSQCTYLWVTRFIRAEVFGQLVSPTRNNNTSVAERIILLLR